MRLKLQSISTAGAIVALSMSLQGCVAAALAPTALSLAAEGVSVHQTGKTITENLKEAILENKSEQAAAQNGVPFLDEKGDDSEQMASLAIAPVPPRKPTPPPMKQEELTIKSHARSIGDFIN